MQILLTTIVILGLAGPALAGHADGIPPGQAEREGGTRDTNGDGRTTGYDYAPGQSAQESDRADLNGDGRTNGKDYAPGQIPRR